MSDAERAQLEAMRFMILGTLSEDPELKAKVDGAYDSLKAIVDEHGDAGKVALSILTCEIGMEQLT